MVDNRRGHCIYGDTGKATLLKYRWKSRENRHPSAKHLPPDAQERQNSNLYPWKKPEICAQIHISEKTNEWRSKGLLGGTYEITSAGFYTRVISNATLDFDPAK